MKKAYYIPTTEAIKMEFPVWMAIGKSIDHDGNLGKPALARRTPAF